MKPAATQALWRSLFALAALEAGAALALLALVPTEAGRFSSPRVAALVLLATSCLAGLCVAWRPPAWTAAPLRQRRIIGLLALSLGFSTALFLLRYWDPTRLASLYARLGVLLWFLLAISLQFLIGALISSHGIRGGDKRVLQKTIGPATIALAALLAVLGIVLVTGLGVTPDSAYWGEPGVPILGWQTALALLVGTGVLLLPKHLDQHLGLDCAVALAMWLLASAVWLSVPVEVLQNSFYAPIRPPAWQPFPNSDAGYYDSMAQSLLIGYPYLQEIPSRPMYIVILAALHAVMGENYALIIGAQTLLLALIPVLFFFVGRILHSRTAGVIVGLLALFRELTTLLVSSHTRVSNSKMLLVDLPTLLMILACVLFAVRWLRHQRLHHAVVTGGMFGLLLLFRTQAAVIIPVAIIFALVVLGARRRATYVHIAVVLGMTVSTLGPWLVRNYISTGHVTLDAEFQHRIIASQYQYTGNLDIGDVDLAGRGLATTLLTFAIKDPLFVLGFIANHFLATQVGALLALPFFHNYAGLSADLNLYWLDAARLWTWQNWILLLAYLVIIGWGVGSAWRRLGWIGLVPLGFSVAYGLANGIGRFSGWRYDLPADWSAYFYFAVGAADGLVLVSAVLGREASMPDRTPTASAPTWPISRTVGVLAAFVIAGSLPWIAEAAVEPRYRGVAVESLAARVAASPAAGALGITGGRLEAFGAEPGAVFEIGRVLYPRYFTRGTGLASAHPWPAYAPRDYPRLGFILLNHSRHDVILPTRDATAEVPHAADAIIVGCRSGEYVEARLIYLIQTGVLLQGVPLGQACP